MRSGMQRIIESLIDQSKFPISNDFHKITEIKSYPKRENLRFYPLTWVRINYKAYPRLRWTKLPKPLRLKKGLETILVSRRSRREFSKEALEIKELSSLLFYSAGIISKEASDWNKALRVYPSAGARFPLEIYIIASRINNLTPGLYHYNVKKHCLELLRKGNFSNFMAKTTAQAWIKKSALVLLISGVLDRTRVKYGDRGYRFILIEAGHLAQNSYLVAEALEIKCCAIGGFLDQEINKFLDLRGIKEVVLYILAFGK